MSWLSPVIMLQKIPCPFGKLGWGISKTVLLEIPEEYPIAPGNTDAPLSPPPLSSPFPVSIHEYTDQIS